MESSKYKGTFGKLQANIKVTNLDGTQLPFWKGLLRLFLKVVSAPICVLDFFMISFNPKNQAFHDYLLGTIVWVEEVKKTNNHSAIKK